ncbi:MAG: tetratricopeptide repeat protein [Chloroflexi bacterium]|nr:tetratricopeptide repeat protein [Chloroflexota bacterium]
MIVGESPPSEQLPVAFGTLLQRHRQAAGLSQEELAELAGISRRGVSDLERGLRRAPYLATIRRLADALHLSEAERSRFIAASRVEPASPRPTTTRPQRMHNLPRQLTSFVGHEGDLLELRKLLASTPLLTLTGAGGMGKTRLALRLAQDMSQEQADGTWLVELAHIVDPQLVPLAIATTLGVPEQPDRSVVDSVTQHIGPKQTLLVLDNCEHVVTACAELAHHLLSSCARVRIIATSREPLRIPGEAVWHVRPLMLPNVNDAFEQVAASEAVRLFVDRATAGQPALRLATRDAPHVVSICRALDGIPLAIELAASRVKLLGVKGVAARLGNALQLLSGGSRTAPLRHQTLRATLEWSYQLLSAAERLLIARMSVFAGGWSLDAAEHVGAERELELGEILDLQQRLVDCCLVQVEPVADGSVRYRLLDTVRQYADEQLHQASQMEVHATHRRHAAFYCQFAEAHEPELIGPLQALWFAHFEREHDNMQAALRWAVDVVDADLALRLGAALVRFWFIRGHLTEGRHWLETLRQLPVGSTIQTAAARAKVINGAGNLATLRGDFDAAWSLLAESLTLRRELGDKAGEARTLMNLGNVAVSEHDYAAAERLFNQSLVLHRELQDTRGIGRTLNNLAVVARDQGEWERMAVLADEALGVSEQIKDPEGVALALISRGIVEGIRGKPDEADALLRRSLSLAVELGHTREIVESIELLAGLECAHGRPERAARLFGVAEAMLEAVGLVPLAGDRFRYAENVAAVRDMLGSDALVSAWRAGREMTFERALEYAGASHL